MAIIGAGVAAAYFLAGSFDVDLFEARSRMILERLNEDKVSLAGITAYVWAKRNKSEGRGNSAIVAVDLRQRPGQDGHLRPSRNTGCMLPNSSTVKRERPGLSGRLLAPDRGKPCFRARNC